jgi:hypothetical protein
MEFWIFAELISDVTNGVNILWDKHVGIVMMKAPSNNIGAYCFPQAYAISGLATATGSTFSTLQSSATNAVLVDMGSTITSGQWIWVRCAVSFPAAKYYVSYMTVGGTQTNSMQTLNPEKLYNTITNDYPYRYYFTSGERSSVFVKNISTHTKKIFLRNLYAFNDYIPTTYTFHYIDLTKVAINTFSSLVMAVNFSNYNYNTNVLNYELYYTNIKNSPTVTLSVIGGATLALSANFSPLPLCDPTQNYQFDLNSLSCVAITQCIKSSLNANYCTKDNTPLSCINNYYYDSGNDGTALNPAVCSASCSNSSPRHPGTNIGNAICNYNCNNVITCPNTSVSQMKNYPTNYICQNGFTRVNYSCITSTVASSTAFYFSKFFNTPNIFRDFTTINTKISNGYLLEFWFKLDNIFSTTNAALTRAYYFYSIPHTIYLDIASNTFKYLNTNLATTSYTMQSIQRYEWNRIIIKYVNVNGSFNLYIFVNYQFTNPEVTILNIPVAVSQNLMSIAFCNTVDGNCSTQGTTLFISWGSAYYRNIRVWDATLATEWLIQSYGVGMYIYY